MKMDNVTILPVIRIERGNSERPSTVGFRVELEIPFFDKLLIAAEPSNSPPGKMAEALILCGLAAIAKQSPEEFYESLMPAKTLSL